MTDQEQTYRRTAQLLEAEIDDEIVALDRERGKCFGFNGVASDVWRLLSKPKSKAQIRTALMADYDVGEAECDQDLAELLDVMGKKGLVEVAQKQ